MSILVLHKRRLFGVQIAAAVVFLASFVPSAFAGAAAEMPSRMEALALDSGPLHHFGSRPAVVFSRDVDLGPEVTWVRLRLTGTELPSGSQLRVTALLDGATQEFDADELERWNYGTAFFNGSALRLEVIAGSRTAGNRVRVEEAFVGERRGSSVTTESAPGPFEPQFICGDLDARTDESDPRVGRLLPGTKPNARTRGWCTASIINNPVGPDKLHVTAGHCFGFTSQMSQGIYEDFVLQFNVPLSNANCNINHPHPRHQYPLRRDRVLGQDGGEGNDWAVFRCEKQMDSTTFQRQQAAFGYPPPDVPDSNHTYPEISIVGYGEDGNGAGPDPQGDPNACSCNPLAGTGSRNFTQQRSEGSAFVTTEKTHFGERVLLRTNAPTCGGNSGSPVVDKSSETLIAIHTGSACDSLCKGGPRNGLPCGVGVGCPGGGVCVLRKNDANTAIDHPMLQFAIRHEKSEEKLPGFSGVAAGILALLFAATGAMVLFRRREGSV